MQWQYQSVENLAGKTIVITGANSGLGLETAKALYAKNANIIIACRNEQKAQQAIIEIKSAKANALGQLDFVSLDLADLESIRLLPGKVKKISAKVDILINNAGVMTPPKGETKQGFETQFGTNHIGHFALTGLLLPLLEKSAAGRIIVVSSLANRFGWINFNNLNSEKYYSKWIAYAQSKLANIIFAQNLQQRLKNSGSKIKVMTVHPGFSATNLQRFMAGSSVINALFSQPAQMGALPSICAATNKDLKGGEYIGPSKLFETRGQPKLAKIPKRAFQSKVAQKLWRQSVEYSQVKYLMD